MLGIGFRLNRRYFVSICRCLSSLHPRLQNEEISRTPCRTFAKVNISSNIATPENLAITKMTKPAAVVDPPQPQPSPMSLSSPEAAILRYVIGEERLQLRLPFKNRIFNFDRAVSDSVQTFLERIATNIGKKDKKFEGEATLWKTTPEGCAKIEETSLSTGDILKEVVNGIYDLHIKISDEMRSVTVNPPEILSIKFFNPVFSGLPVFPYKIETSNTFDQYCSKYRWEVNRNPKANIIPNAKKKNSLPSEPSNDGWTDTGCSSYIFIPSDEHVGARLRFICHPSNGRSEGIPFSEEIPGVVEKRLEEPLFLERIKRIAERNKTGDKSSDPDFLRTVSYNCLAECYATEEWFISSPKLSLPPDFRLPFLCKEFAAYDADIYCLQEVEVKYFERIFSPFLKQTKGLKGVMSPKTGTVKEGVATFYNPKKLELLRSETVVIADHIKTMKKVWKCLPENVQVRLNDRNSVFQVSIFKVPHRPNMIFIIANTHLYFHPDADHIRLLQTSGCVDYLETICSEIKKEFSNAETAVLFCGDFNCTPPYSSYRYLTSGKIEKGDFDWTSHSSEKVKSGIELKHNLQLVDSNLDYQLTNITTCFEGCIDYILYQPTFMDLLQSYSPPSKEDLARLTGVSDPAKVSFPNFYTPSDHLPLITDFAFKKS